ncbi:MAG: inositol monophosphatase [Candidatus Omnitrophica bacterium]|nr:inositol monophosphatase [Candidatus Omnitrophota bacterium]
MSEFLNVAVKAAKAAGKIHLKYFDKDLKTKSKGRSFDLVTVADTETEKRIVSEIRSFFPDHNFLGEEDTYKKTGSKYTWIIDPLDGTNNFAHHVPIFCVSIALAKGDEVILGVIYDVTRNELFHTEKGKGAFLNKKRISVSSAENLRKAILITGFYYDRGDEMVMTLDTVKRFLELQVMGIRRFGAAALDLCNIACGRASGFWEFLLNPWDFAAGKLLVEEAGGRVTGPKGEDIGLKPSFLIASNGKIHSKMLEIINR